MDTLDAAPIPARDAYLSATFGEDGYLSRAFPGYRPRAGQVALAHAVDKAITIKQHLLAEAGTGVGKSIGYAVPATYYAHETGKTVVIVTSSINLQEQLVEKDLPLLRKILPWPFTFGLLKGRHHYLCEKKRHQYELEKRAQRGFGFLDDTEKRHLDVVAQWAADSSEAGPEVETGDKSELPFEPSPTIWRQFSVDSSDCTKSRCKYHQRCFPNTMQRRAREARVVVTNYHMLFAHLLLEADRGLYSILPRFDVLLADEAHKMPSIARDAFGFRFTEESVRRLARKVDHGAIARKAEQGAALFFHSMQNLRRDYTRYKARLTGDFSAAEMLAWREIYEGMQGVRDVFRDRVAELEREIEAGADAKTALGEAEVLYDRAHEIVENLKAVVNPELDERHVYFLEEDTKSRVAVAAKVVFPADLLGPLLFHRQPEKLPKDPSSNSNDDPFPDKPPPSRAITVVATSATLATSGDNFDFIASELGARAYATLRAESPFRWRDQALFICPKGMPDPNSAEFKDVVAKTLAKIILLAGGRTLGLFTSKRVLEFAYDSLIGTCKRQGITLLKQGDAPRTQLIARFREDVTSVLLGTESFYAGVDVPGEALSVVVMDRLPFPSPDDPIAAAIGARDDKSFFRYNVPVAVIQFKQGFGRLVRSEACRGVVVCLDGRLLTKKYRSEFLRAMPSEVGKTTELDEIAAWLPPVTNRPLPLALPEPLPLLAPLAPLPADDLDDAEIPF